MRSRHGPRHHGDVASHGDVVHREAQIAERGTLVTISASSLALTNQYLLVKNMVMIKANVADAKARLSEYLDRVQTGERIVICRHNTPIAELRALERSRVEPRPIGPLPGRPTFVVPPSFFDPLPDAELELWEGAATTTAMGSARPATRSTRVAKDKATSGDDAGRTRRRRRS